MKRSYELEFVKSVLQEECLRVSFAYYEAEQEVRDAMERGELEQMSQSERRGMMSKLDGLQVRHARLEKAIHFINNQADLQDVVMLEPEQRNELFSEGVPF